MRVKGGVVYVRVYRGGRWQNVAFHETTDDELKEILEARGEWTLAKWARELAGRLAGQPAHGPPVMAANPDEPDGSTDTTVDGVVCGWKYDDKNDIGAVTVSFKAEGRRPFMLDWPVTVQLLLAPGYAPSCHSCKCEMVKGEALKNTVHAAEDFGGDADSPGATLLRTGPAVMVQVWKCPMCGRSVQR